MHRIKTILVTGAAGFIGSNLCLKLFEKYENIHIIGIDNMNAYYDVNIKKWRLSEIERVAGVVSSNGSRCAYSARTAHPFRRNGAPFRFKLSKAQLVD